MGIFLETSIFSFSSSSLLCVTWQLFTKDASKSWRHGDVGTQLTFKDPSANVVLLDYISTNKWQQIVDFDDHLDDISKYVHMIYCICVSNDTVW